MSHVERCDGYNSFDNRPKKHTLVERVSEKNE